ncbi:Obg family GTPase CgtA, partial [Candidatus Peregrinibacteria bacterium]|nr:Obg family GTPase CgtA [Candidatus Peregrinibacteria bacterium]
IKVPVGTIIYDAATGDQLVDLKKHLSEFHGAKGGRGGYGNGHFASSVRQSPKFAELGDIGQIKSIRLEIQLVADLGLLGLPSAGKSTLISHVTAAKPKVGASPFTTLVPNLGVVNLSKFGGDSEQSFVIADMPGIIEGASEGKGLGDKFLRHISRSAILLYLLDPFAYENQSISDQYKMLHDELEKFNPELIKKEFFVVMNKIDAIPDEDREELRGKLLTDYPELKDKFFMASGVSGENLDKLIFAAWNMIQKADELPEDLDDSDDLEEYVPVALIDDQGFKVEKIREIKSGELGEPLYGQLIADESLPTRTLYYVTGQRIEQISRMTNTEYEGGIHRVYDVMKKMNIKEALRKEGAKTGDYIKIGPNTFEFHDLK